MTYGQSSLRLRILFSTRNLPRQFTIIPASTTNPGSDDFEVTNKKKTFMLVLVSEDSQVSEINAAVIRKLWVKKYLASAEQQKQQEKF